MKMASKHKVNAERKYVKVAILKDNKSKSVNWVVVSSNDIRAAVAYNRDIQPDLKHLWTLEGDFGLVSGYGSC